MKKIITIFIILFISGCSVNYDVVINENGTVSEIVEFKNILEDEKDNLKISVNGYNKSNNSNYVFDDEKNIVSNYYKSINDFNYSAFNNQIFEYIQINDDQFNSNVTIESVGIKSHRFICENNEFDCLLVNNIIITIKLPYKVISHNADITNDNIGLYTWELSKNNYKDKSIRLIYNSKQREEYLVKSKVNKSKKEKVGLIIFIVIIICFLLSFLIYVVYKNKKVNNL